jgi:cobalt-precorrin 5A hydrolase / precorrin-3B C17-methyltransferase
VIAVAEDGSSVIPLLGGHHGANALAQKIAALTGGHAAITTASEVRFGSAFDEDREGYTLANPDDMKAATAARLAGGEVRVETTEHLAKGGPNHIVYHPHTLTIGVGCERGTSPQEVEELIKTTLKANNLSIQSVAGFTSLDLKEDEPALNNLPNVRFFTAGELNEHAAKLKNPSDYVKNEVGTPGVAEAAALAAGGPDAELIVPQNQEQAGDLCHCAQLHPHS